MLSATAGGGIHLTDRLFQFVGLSIHEMLYQERDVLAPSVERGEGDGDHIEAGENQVVVIV